MAEIKKKKNTTKKVEKSITLSESKTATKKNAAKVQSQASKKRGRKPKEISEVNIKENPTTSSKKRGRKPKVETIYMEKEPSIKPNQTLNEEELPIAQVDNELKANETLESFDDKISDLSEEINEEIDLTVEKEKPISITSDNEIQDSQVSLADIPEEKKENDEIVESPIVEEPIIEETNIEEPIKEEVVEETTPKEEINNESSWDKFLNETFAQEEKVNEVVEETTNEKKPSQPTNLLQKIKNIFVIQDKPGESLDEAVEDDLTKNEQPTQETPDVVIASTNETINEDLQENQSEDLTDNKVEETNKEDETLTDNTIEEANNENEELATTPTEETNASDDTIVVPANIQEENNQKPEKKGLFGKKKNDDNNIEYVEPRFLRKKRLPFLRFLLKLILFAIIIVAIVIGSYVFTLSYCYKPIGVDGKDLSITKIRTWYIVPNDRSYTLMSYNIDGGVYNPNKVNNKDVLVHRNINGVVSILKKHEPNFITLQDVDSSSTRSNKIDETDLISQQLLPYSKIFCQNFRTMYKFWPIPNFEGMRNSGLFTLSQYHVNSATRYNLPHDEPIPQKYFAKDACFSITTVGVARSEYNLLLINIDMSDYDAGYNYDKQLDKIQEVIGLAHEQGSFIIISGCFHADFVDELMGLEASKDNDPVLKSNTIWEGYKLVVPSNSDQLRTEKNPESNNKLDGWIQDGFIVSENVEATAEIIDTDFQYSSHNPVLLTFTLKR